MSSQNAGGINPYDAPETEQSEAEKAQTPAWGWAFFAACLAIMIVTRGGAIWGAVGGGFGGLCIKVSQNPNLSVATRVALCCLITVALWAGILGLVWALQRG